jgi:hypothetical protein
VLIVRFNGQEKQTQAVKPLKVIVVLGASVALQGLPIPHRPAGTIGGSGIR